MVFSLAYHFLHNQSQAEELSQDVFLELHRNFPKLQSEAHVRFWLRKVTSQRCIDQARRQSRRPESSLENAPEPSAAVAQADPMLDHLLRRLVSSLPPRARAIVVLRYQEDLEPGEIAAVLGIPIGTVKSQLHRALAVLREKMTRTGAARSGRAYV